MRRSDSAPVAQLDRVLGYEPRGRAFESLRAHQQNNPPKVEKIGNAVKSSLGVRP